MSHQLRLFDFDESELIAAIQQQAQEERALSSATVQSQSAKERLKLCQTSYEEACKRVSRLTHEATMKTAKIKDLHEVEAEVVEGELVEDAPPAVIEDAEVPGTAIVLMTREGGAVRAGEGDDLRTADEWEASGRFPGSAAELSAGESEDGDSTALVATGGSR